MRLKAESSSTPETNTPQFHIFAHKLNDTERLWCHILSQSSSNTQVRYIFLAGRTFCTSVCVSCATFWEPHAAESYILLPKWHGLPLQWQHCLKEDVHKWTLRCRIVIYPKSPGPNKRINPSAPPNGRFIGKLYLVRGLLCIQRVGGRANSIQLGF